VASDLSERATPAVRLVVGLGNAERERRLVPELTDSGQMDVVARCLAADQVADALRRTRADIAVLALDLHRLNDTALAGLAATGLPLIGLATRHDEATRGPWAAVLPVDAEPQQLRATITAVLRGERLEPALAGADEDAEPVIQPQLSGPDAASTSLVVVASGKGSPGCSTVPLTDALGASPLGTWPLWTWAAGFAVGFLAPDWELTRRLARRQARVVMELPIICDMLSLCTAGGQGLEQALNTLARQSAGTMAQELQHVSREVAFGQRSLMEALAGLAERNAVPELSRFVSQLQAASEQGVPVVQALSAQADALREEKRVRIVAEGGRAAIRMLLPVAGLILPVYFVLLLGPAVLQVVHLGG